MAVVAPVIVETMRGAITGEKAGGEEEDEEGEEDCCAGDYGDGRI